MRPHVLFLLVLAAVPLCAQPISIGAKIGIPFIDPMSGHAESRPYEVGPTVELRLPAGFAIEASAIYRRLGQSAAYFYTDGTVSSYNSYRTRGNSWDFPLIGKHYFGRRTSKYQPFLGTGWALRTIRWSQSGTVYSGGDLSGAPQPSQYQWNHVSELNVGATAVAGVRFRAGRMTVLPEIRYTRWGRDYYVQRMNDVGFFLGLRF